jgi:Domain of unknown function (DUF4190)
MRSGSGTNGMAIASLVASVISLLPLPVLFIFWILAIAAALVPAVAGIVMGVVALRQLKTNPRQGKGLAIAGITVGAWTVAVCMYGLVAPFLS